MCTFNTHLQEDRAVQVLVKIVYDPTGSGVYSEWSEAGDPPAVLQGTVSVPMINGVATFENILLKTLDDRLPYFVEWTSIPPTTTIRDFASLIPCGAGFIQGFDAVNYVICVECPFGTYNRDGQDCYACPIGAICNGGDRIQVRFGVVARGWSINLHLTGPSWVLGGPGWFRLPYLQEVCH